MGRQATGETGRQTGMGRQTKQRQKGRQAQTHIQRNPPSDRKTQTDTWRHNHSLTHTDTVMDKHGHRKGSLTH